MTGLSLFYQSKNSRFMEKKRLLFVCFGILLLALSGCASNTIMANTSCAVPSTKSLDLALKQSKSVLMDVECAIAFGEHFENLLRVAEANPAPSNNKRFSQFLEWSEIRGIIGSTKAKTDYTGYFSRTFASLPDDYSNCSSTCLRVPAVRANLKAELSQKERGSRILADKQLLIDAHQDFQKVQLLLEATCISCQQRSL